MDEEQFQSLYFRWTVCYIERDAKVNQVMCVCSADSSRIHLISFKLIILEFLSTERVWLRQKSFFLSNHRHIVKRIHASNDARLYIFKSGFFNTST